MHEDKELLQLYATTRSQEAFASLVQRHLPLVHSAALRQTGDPHRAEEVAQTVFLILARKAGELQQHPALGGWLYTTTGYTAAKVQRSEQRRRRREQEAQTMQDHDAPADWEQMRPVIDETMLLLKDEDRTAVLLRFFENRAYGEIGTRLGLSENAARMRVDRALETLRSALERRGILSTATALGAALTAQAVLSPPAGLAIAIATNAGSAKAGGAILLLMKSTALKPGLVVAVLGLGTAGLLWQHLENTRLRDEVRQLRHQAATAALAAPSVPKPATSQDGAELDRLRARIAELSRNPAVSWQNRVEQLRQLLAQLPEQNIPELALATEEDWLEAAKPEMSTEGDYRRALGRLRTLATQRFTSLARMALERYVKSHDGAFPTEPAQLQPYLLERTLDAAIWRGYEVQPAASVPNVHVGGDWVITNTELVDEEFDMKFVVGPNGIGASSSILPHQSAAFDAVVKAYTAANPGKNNGDFNQLLPYATTSEQRQAVQKVIDLTRNR